MTRGSTSNRFLDRYVGIPVLRAAAIFNRRRPMPSAFHAIGILASPTLGDTLLTSGAVLDIRRAFPKAQLVYFAAPGSRAAVKLIPDIDRIVPIDMADPALTLRTIRACRLDLMVDFSQWQRITAFYAGFSGARYRLGFHSLGQARHWLYDSAVLHSTEIHELDNFRALVRALGVRPAAQPRLEVPNTDRLAVSPSVVFHPWASGKRAALREWPSSNWVELATHLASDNTTFFITGTAAELPRSQSLAADLQCAGLRAEPFLGQNGLVGVSRLIKSSELVVSVNTGIMHLAAILGAPTIGLNGPTASHRWGPVGPRARSVEPRGGGGFLHFGWEFTGNPTDTMQRIHVDDVHATAKALLTNLHQTVGSA